MRFFKQFSLLSLFVFSACSNHGDKLVDRGASRSASTQVTSSAEQKLISAMKDVDPSWVMAETVSKPDCAQLGITGSWEEDGSSTSIKQFGEKLQAKKRIPNARGETSGLGAVNIYSTVQFDPSLCIYSEKAVKKETFVSADEEIKMQEEAVSSTEVYYLVTHWSQNPEELVLHPCSDKSCTKVDQDNWITRRRPLSNLNHVLSNGSNL